jgi:aminopeptidase
VLAEGFMSHSSQVDPELLPGAHNAVHTCLRLRPEERVTVVTDRETWDIAAALVREVAELGAEHSVFVLEDHAPRPLANMPRPILEDLSRSQVSTLPAQLQAAPRPREGTIPPAISK